MKKYYLLFLGVLLFCFTAIAHATPMYVEGINDLDYSDPNIFRIPGVQYGPDKYTGDYSEYTYAYAPSLDYNLTMVEFYIFDQVAYADDFFVIIREDSGDPVGAPVDGDLGILGQANFNLSSTPGYQGVEFASPIGLEAGKLYWVGFFSETILETVFGTGAVTYYKKNGSWSGPSTIPFGPGIKFYETPVPEPATMLLLGSGLLGLAGFRRKFRKRK